MDNYGVRKIILSSSANVLMASQALCQLPRVVKLGIVQIPYGRTKWVQEEMLRDVFTADDRWNIVILRYFNPAGAHESGLIGEMYGKSPSNIVPSLALAANGDIPYFKVLGTSYNTPDGTGIRDIFI